MRPPLSSFGRRATLLASLLLISCRPAAATEWILTFAVTEDRVVASPKGDTAPRTETRHYTQTVALGPDYLAVQDDRQKIVQDFTGRRMIVTDLAKGTYQDWSLYSLPSFFEHELFNRSALDAAMRAAKIDQGAGLFSRFDRETALRVEPRRAPPDSPALVIETVKSAGVLEFRHQDVVAVRFTAADTVFPAPWHHRFVNYLTYSCCVHPQIRRALADTGAIPQEMVIRWRNLNTATTATLRLLTSAAADTNSSSPPAKATFAAPTDDPLYATLAASNAMARLPARPGRAEVIKFADAAVAAQQPLDAALALLEFGLQSGEQLTDELGKHRAAFNRDKTCQAYFGAFKQRTKEEAEHNLATNASISRQGLTKGYMLDLQRANLLERVGRPGEARELLLKVVQANPYHAGALHDLGMIYLRSFEHPKAWLCWDAARRLYPDHRMMSDVTRLEQTLLTNEPDFF